MILLTGSAGFIGSHLSNALVESYRPENILLFTSKSRSDCKVLLHNNYVFDKDIFVNAGYDKIHTIIHAGAYTPKNQKQSNSFLFCNSNIKNTEALLMSNLPNLKRIIFLSTLDVYGHCEEISENSEVNPISLYGHSKFYCEKMISMWAESNGIVSQILRIGHVYGPGEDAYEKIIPSNMRRLIKNHSLELWGIGNELRAFIYIKDVVRMILQALHLNRSYSVINIAGQRRISVKELIVKIANLEKHKNIEIKEMNSSSIGRSIVFNTQLMNSLLGVEQTSLEEGLKNEYEFMKKLGG